MLDKWIAFYDSMSEDNAAYLNFESVAIGFFCALGATYAEACNLYNIDCIRINKF